MFMDMSVMVEAQGDMLDDIETQVSTRVFVTMVSLRRLFH